MRISAYPVLLCVGLGACASGPSNKESLFVKPNDLMSREIDDRISQIPFQQREELFNNLLWLSQTGEQAIPSLLEALEHDNAKVRSNTLWVLGRIRDRRTIPNMQVLVADSDPTVRFEAARTLVLMGDMQHVPVLVEGLDSSKRQVRYLCHQALSQATGRNFGYDHLDEDLTSRHQAAYRWRKWWADQSGDPWFAKDYASDKGLDVFEAENQWLGSTPSAPNGETEQAPVIDTPEPVETANPGANQGIQVPQVNPGTAEPQTPAVTPIQTQGESETPETTENGWVDPVPSVESPTGEAPDTTPPGGIVPFPVPPQGGNGTGDGR